MPSPAHLIHSSQPPPPPPPPASRCAPVRGPMGTEARQAPAAPSAAEAAWRSDLVAELNAALAGEMACAQRYRRHHYRAYGLASQRFADGLAVYAAEELVHANRLVRRIVELGGQPSFEPLVLAGRGHVGGDDSAALKTMIQANLSAARAAIESYSRLVRLVGERDPTTRRVLEEILGEEHKHADELQSWLSD